MWISVLDVVRMIWHTSLYNIERGHVQVFDMYMSYGWGSTGENVTSERYTT